MNKSLFQIYLFLLLLFLSFDSPAQTEGTLEFSFTPTSHVGFSGTRHVLAVWIQDNTGIFVKTRLRQAGGGDTKDHLEVWAINSGGSVNNCLSASCNTVDAVTGATLQSYGTRTIMWDAKDVNAAIVADGTYQVTIEQTWNHGNSGTTTRSFAFVKDALGSFLTPADDANFTNISLKWTPGLLTIGEVGQNPPIVNIYPNPSKSSFYVSSENASKIQIINNIGSIVFEKTINKEASGEMIDLSSFPSGVFNVVVSNDKESIIKRVVLNK